MSLGAVRTQGPLLLALVMLHLHSSPFFFMYLFICIFGCVHVFVAVPRLSLVVRGASRGCSLVAIRELLVVGNFSCRGKGMGSGMGLVVLRHVSSLIPDGD